MIVLYIYLYFQSAANEIIRYRSGTRWLKSRYNLCLEALRTQGFGRCGCHASEHKGLDTVVPWELINMRRHAWRASAKSPVYLQVSPNLLVCQQVCTLNYTFFVRRYNGKSVGNRYFLNIISSKT